MNPWPVTEVISRVSSSLDSLGNIPQAWKNNKFPLSWLNTEQDMYSRNVVSNFAYNRKLALLLRWDSAHDVYDVMTSLFEEIEAKRAPPSI